MLAEKVSEESPAATTPADRRLSIGKLLEDPVIGEHVKANYVSTLASSIPCTLLTTLLPEAGQSAPVLDIFHTPEQRRFAVAQANINRNQLCILARQLRAMVMDDPLLLSRPSEDGSLLRDKQTRYKSCETLICGLIMALRQQVNKFRHHSIALALKEELLEVQHSLRGPFSKLVPIPLQWGFFRKSVVQPAKLVTSSMQDVRSKNRCWPTGDVTKT